jgi:hypothetical protein
MVSLSLEEAVNCLIAIDQVRLKTSLAYLMARNEATINLLVDSYQVYLDRGKFSLAIAATPDCNAQGLYELILEKYRAILPKKYKFEIPLSVNKSRRVSWEAIERWRSESTSEANRPKSPLFIVSQAEYLKAPAIRELRDLNSRLGVSVLLLSDRSLTKTVEAAEGKQRFTVLNYSLLLGEGLQTLQREIEEQELESYEQYLLFFEKVKYQSSDRLRVEQATYQYS